MKKVVVITISVLLASLHANSQSLTDSIAHLYSSYYGLLQARILDSLAMADLEQQLASAEDSIASLNENYTNYNDNLSAITSELSTIRVGTASEVNLRTHRIRKSVRFVQAANTSLNVVKASAAVSDYMVVISNLNNASNDELGFSIVKEVQKKVSAHIIKDRKKINGSRGSKILGIVNTIINSPVVETSFGAIPIISSIKGVFNLVNSLAVSGDDIEVKDVQRLQRELQVYIEHYQRLSRANDNFRQASQSLKVRQNALALLLDEYAKERANVLFRYSSDEMTHFDTISLTDFLAQYFYADIVDARLEGIQESSDLLEQVNDPRLFFPYYSLRQAKFIRDEIKSLRLEYQSAINAYQSDIEQALVDSYAIGDKESIDSKIGQLREKKLAVIQQINESFDLLSLERTFSELETVDYLGR